jgi:hypothetical protein
VIIPNVQDMNKSISCDRFSAFCPTILQFPSLPTMEANREPYFSIKELAPMIYEPIQHEDVCFVTIHCGHNKDKQILPSLRAFIKKNPKTKVRVLLFDAQVSEPEKNPDFHFAFEEHLINTWRSRAVAMELHARGFDYDEWMPTLATLAMQMTKAGGLLIVADFTPNTPILSLWESIGYEQSEHVRIMTTRLADDVSHPVWQFEIQLDPKSMQLTITTPIPENVGTATDLAHALEISDAAAVTTLAVPFLDRLERARVRYFLPLAKIFALLENWFQPTFDELPQETKDAFTMAKKARTTTVQALKIVWQNYTWHLDQALVEACDLLALTGPRESSNVASFNRERFASLLATMFNNAGHKIYAPVEAPTLLQKFGKLYEEVQRLVQDAVAQVGGRDEPKTKRSRSDDAEDGEDDVPASPPKKQAPGDGWDPVDL